MRFGSKLWMVAALFVVACGSIEQPDEVTRSDDLVACAGDPECLGRLDADVAITTSPTCARDADCAADEICLRDTCVAAASCTRDRSCDAGEAGATGIPGPLLGEHVHAELELSRVR